LLYYLLLIINKNGLVKSWKIIQTAAKTREKLRNITGKAKT